VTAAAIVWELVQPAHRQGSQRSPRYIVVGVSIRGTVTKMASNAAARRATPVVATRGARQFLDRAIDGFTGFPGAREIARRHLSRRRDVDSAIRDSIDQHVRLAGAQGFVTNIGGFVAMPITIPANLAGIALLQVRMVAATLHMRGYDIADPRVRTAALVTLLGEEEVRNALKAGTLPGLPHDIAVAPGDASPELLTRIASDVTSALVTRISGKHVTLTVARRVPLIGGAVSAGVDAYSTYVIGQYANREFPPHVMIERA
jgi:hypothetical protein